jgi:hypothetical protein
MTSTSQIARLQTVGPSYTAQPLRPHAAMATTAGSSLARGLGPRSVGEYITRDKTQYSRTLVGAVRIRLAVSLPSRASPVWRTHSAAADASGEVGRRPYDSRPLPLSSVNIIHRGNVQPLPAPSSPLHLSPPLDQLTVTPRPLTPAQPFHRSYTIF